ncbi:facilitated trehalose transporter Tret1-like [Anthonomus grandis grandis]|uniref:facilitated trehalose transporter Tret1-like n=1 Tax=Anthonomus grandis grandis TaxID=2921223 RepID=UPI00216630F5|nr:facilitated trehalose transporter Tret1-like [Anthonomus grandis grandis]
MGTALQYLAAATGNLAIVTDGMHYGWPSPSLPQLENNTNSTLCLTSDEGALLAVMPLLGAILGALTAANVVDYLGRKKTIILTSVPFFLAWIVVAFAQTVMYLYIARFIAGIADGVTFTVVPMYIGEIAEPRVRGLLGSSCSVSWILGFLLINLIGSYLSIKTTALISSSLCVVTIATFIWMPESPYYLLMKNKTDKAKESLRRFRSDKVDVETEISKIRKSIMSTEKVRGSFFDLFTVASNRKAVIIVAGLRGFQQFSGTTAITFYAQEIFKQAGSNVSSKEASIIYFAVMLVMTMLSSSIVDRAGRKPLLIISMSGSILALFLEGTYFYIEKKTSIDVSDLEYIPVSCLIMFVIFFSIGMQSIPICLLGELFPTSVKAYALCLADVYFSLVASVASKFLQLMKDSYGIHMAFYGFTLFSIMGLLFIIFVVPETKGKSLEEIQMYLRGETPKMYEVELQSMERLQKEKNATEEALLKA